MYNWYSQGWDGSDTTDETDLQWSFAGALLYAVTVITTIGKLPQLIWPILTFLLTSPQSFKSPNLLIVARNPIDLKS